MIMKKDFHACERHSRLSYFHACERYQNLSKEEKEWW